MNEEPLFPESILKLAVDPDLPEGVIKFRHPDGRRDRFPLIELMVDEDQP